MESSGIHFGLSWDLRRNIWKLCESAKNVELSSLFGLQLPAGLRPGLVRAPSGLRPGSVRAPSRARPGRALESADVPKTCNCRRFWGLGCLGTYLGLVQNLPPTGLAHVGSMV